MLTPKISGLFDVRDYDGKTKEHNLRKMKAETDNIAFSAVFDKNALPECFIVNDKPDELLKERVSRREKESAEREGRQAVPDMYAAGFKISPTTKWFDKYAKSIDKPLNEELEQNRWMVQIDFVRREKDPLQPLKPSGYWVNAIMVAKQEQNPFEGQAFEIAADEPEAETEEKPIGAIENDGLPFD